MMIQKYNQLTKVHQLIKKQYKGTPDEIAGRLGISKSSMYRALEELEQLGAEYKYCRTCMCFKYTNSFKLKITIETNEMTQILGGQNFVQRIDFDKNKQCFVNQNEFFSLHPIF